jgi:hypothetical protein
VVVISTFEKSTIKPNWTYGVALMISCHFWIYLTYNFVQRRNFDLIASKCSCTRSVSYCSQNCSAILASFLSEMEASSDRRNLWLIYKGLVGRVFNISKQFLTYEVGGYKRRYGLTAHYVDSFRCFRAIQLRIPFTFHHYWSRTGTKMHHFPCGSVGQNPEHLPKGLVYQ